MTKSVVTNGRKERRSATIGLAPVRVSNAVPSTLFSAAAELAEGSGMGFVSPLSRPRTSSPTPFAFVKKTGGPLEEHLGQAKPFYDSLTQALRFIFLLFIAASVF
jgi:hypothetical protein